MAPNWGPNRYYLSVMVMKGYSIFFKDPGVEPQHQMLRNVIIRTLSCFEIMDNFLPRLIFAWFYSCIITPESAPINWASKMVSIVQIRWGASKEMPKGSPVHCWKEGISLGFPRFGKVSETTWAKIPNVNSQNN